MKMDYCYNQIILKSLSDSTETASGSMARVVQRAGAKARREE